MKLLILFALFDSLISDPSEVRTFPQFGGSDPFDQSPLRWLEVRVEETLEDACKPARVLGEFTRWISLSENKRSLDRYTVLVELNGPAGEKLSATSGRLWMHQLDPDLPLDHLKGDWVFRVTANAFFVVTNHERHGVFVANINEAFPGEWKRQRIWDWLNTTSSLYDPKYRNALWQN